jgi:hypothetical protein
MANPNRSSEFQRLQKDPEYKSSGTSRDAKNPEAARSGATTGRARGVEHPIPEDMALFGDTRHTLHHQSLPKVLHPYSQHQNEGYPEAAGSLRGSDQFRVDSGGGADGDL